MHRGQYSSVTESELVNEQKRRYDPNAWEHIIHYYTHN